MALALAALVVAAGARAAPSGAGGDGDETVLGQLAAARSVAAAAGDAIWPGFDLRTIPIAVYESGGEALVIQVREAPEDFERLPAEGLTTPVYRGPATEAMNANTSGRLGGEVAAFIQRGSLSNGARARRHQPALPRVRPRLPGARPAGRGLGRGGRGLLTRRGVSRSPARRG
jgi:hypothetical protein